MDGIVDDTPSADHRLLASVQSILEGEELDTATRSILMLDTVRQFVIFTGADTANARQGAPLGALSSPYIGCADGLGRIFLSFRKRLRVSN